ncbi:MAG: transglutaminaseTgpA domain-containing protein, partial [Gammaproteobacteria bacterium]|nr:transglutaminaseTgpA domain-containing protein [Gammaproteobacteria bacterium]
MNFLHKLQHPDVQPASFFLLLGVLLVLLPHYAHLPVWLIIITLMLIVWRGCYELQLCSLPGKTILFIFTLMLLLGIIFSFHTLLGRNAGSAMLLGLLCLKLFEIHRFRDISFIINIALFS